MRTCELCGKVFQAKRSTARYCSPAHRQAAFRKKNPERTNIKRRARARGGFNIIRHEVTGQILDRRPRLSTPKYIQSDLRWSYLLMPLKKRGHSGQRSYFSSPAPRSNLEIFRLGDHPPPRPWAELKMLLTRTVSVTPPIKGTVNTPMTIAERITNVETELARQMEITK